MLVCAVRGRRAELVAGAPTIVGIVLVIVWPLTWALLSASVPNLDQYVPLPASSDARLLLLGVTTVLVPGYRGIADARPGALWDPVVGRGTPGPLPQVQARACWAFRFRRLEWETTRQSDSSAAQSAGAGTTCWT